ncbi:MAG: DUF4139 domain-containing protein [Aureispira sp.]
MKHSLWLCLFSLLCPALLVAQNDTIPLASTINKVDVYRKNARVHRVSKTNVPTGPSTIVLENISSKLLINSIQVKIKNKQVALVAALPRMNYEQVFAEKKRSPKRLGVITDSLTILSREQSEIEIERNSINSIRQLMMAHNPLGSKKDAGFTVQQIKELMEFRKKELIEMDMNLLDLREQQTKAQLGTNRLNNELARLQQKIERSSGQLVLQVQADKATSTDIEISYVVAGAGWSPLYDIKSDGVGKPLNLVYKAQVYQNTGYDWKQVKLSLSSSDPTMSHDRPILSPFRIGIVAQAVPEKGPIAKAKKGNTYIQYQGSGNVILEQAYVRNDPRRGVYGAIANTPQIRSVTALDAQSDMINSNSARGMTNNAYFNKNESEKSYSPGEPMTKFDLSANSENTTINFDVDLMQYIPSDGQTHVVTIKEESIPVEYEYHIVPKLDKNAFLLAKVTEHGKYNLMRGMANIFFEDVYLGQSILDPAVITDTLLLSLGRDEQIGIKRERLSEERKKMGNNVREELTFQVSIRNNKNVTIPITVLDQIPLSSNEKLEVNLIESSGAKYYKPYGSLRWQQKLAANKTTKFRYTYQVKYPKDHSIVRE